MSVQPYLRTVAAEGRERVEVGGFEIFVNPGSASPGSNYAIPLDDAEPTPDDVTALAAAFETRGRTPRLEFLSGTAPAAETALIAAGFEVELRTPVMHCAPQERRRPPLPDGLTLTHLQPGTPKAAVQAMLTVQAHAFGEEPDPLRRDLADRWLGHWLTVFARVDGEPAGAGMCLGVHEATTELVGIAVADRFRCRGIAGALTAELARLAFDAGAVSAFMTPGDATAGRAYARAGFSPDGTMLHLRRN